MDLEEVSPQPSQVHQEKPVDQMSQKCYFQSSWCSHIEHKDCPHLLISLPSEVLTRYDKGPLDLITVAGIRLGDELKFSA